MPARGVRQPDRLWSSHGPARRIRNRQTLVRGNRRARRHRLRPPLRPPKPPLPAGDHGRRRRPVRHGQRRLPRPVSGAERESVRSVGRQRQSPVSQPRQRHVRRRDRAQRRRRSRLWHGRHGGRLRQRRPHRPVHHQLRAQRPAEERRSRTLHRRHRESGRGQFGLEHERGVCRLRRRWRARPVCRPLPELAAVGRSRVFQPDRRARLLQPGKLRSARSCDPVSQQRGRHIFRRVRAVGCVGRCRQRPRRGRGRLRWRRPYRRAGRERPHAESSLAESRRRSLSRGSADDGLRPRPGRRREVGHGGRRGRRRRRRRSRSARGESRRRVGLLLPEPGKILRRRHGLGRPAHTEPPVHAIRHGAPRLRQRRIPRSLRSERSRRPAVGALFVGSVRGAEPAVPGPRGTAVR